MRHRLFIPAATALLFALAACTQDELAGDNRLPEGEYLYSSVPPDCP
mgnify:CR=1 FL=1